MPTIERPHAVVLQELLYYIKPLAEAVKRLERGIPVPMSLTETQVNKLLKELKNVTDNVTMDIYLLDDSDALKILFQLAPHCSAMSKKITAAIFERWGEASRGF